MTHRNHCTPSQLCAHEILDRIFDGEDVGDDLIPWALEMLGEFSCAWKRK